MSSRIAAAGQNLRNDRFSRRPQVDNLTRILGMPDIKVPDEAENVDVLKNLIDGLGGVTREAMDLRIRTICSEILARVSTDLNKTAAALAKNAYGGKDGTSWKQPLNATSTIDEVR